MNRVFRLVSVAGATAALLAGLMAGSVFAAGSPTVGHVYVNNNSAGHNSVAGFDRHADGSLTAIPGSPFNAGGAGTGVPFGSAGGLQESSDGRYILATDPGSNDISVLRIMPNGPILWAGNGDPGAAVSRPSSPIRNPSRYDGPEPGPTRVPTRRRPLGLISTCPGIALLGSANVESAMGVRRPPALRRKPV